MIERPLEATMKKNILTILFISILFACTEVIDEPTPENKSEFTIPKSDSISYSNQDTLIFDVLSNDSIAGEFDITLNQPQRGSVQFIERNDSLLIQYIRNPNFLGQDIFSYTLCNQSKNCNTVNVLIVPTNPDTCNFILPSTNRTINISESIVLNTLGINSCNDVVYTITGSVQGGILIDSINHTITYTASAFEAKESFTLNACNAFGNCKSASYAFDVIDTCKQKFSITPDTFSVKKNSFALLIDLSILAKNDIKCKDDSINISSFTAISQPQLGNLTKNTPSLIYNPSQVGTEEIEYSFCLTNGHCTTGKLYITIIE